MKKVIRKTILPLLKYFKTLRHLKIKQLRYQLWYRIRKYLRKLINKQYTFNKTPADHSGIEFHNSIENRKTYFGTLTFKFLNQEHSFKRKVNWDFLKYGKLWCYSLNYFEYLNQENSSQYTEEFQVLIDEFVSQLPDLNNANEPFPTSLRIINWVKYFSDNKIENKEWDKALYNQLYVLDYQLEFHLLGNHLLENAYALFIGGAYFRDEKFLNKGIGLLQEQLEEQILDDGAHFELSPMYHNLMLYRFLDCIQIFQKNKSILYPLFEKVDNHLQFLRNKAALMCGWLDAIKYNDTEFPHFNDSTDGITPTLGELLKYADKLNIPYKTAELSDSGYRRLNNEYFDLIVKSELTQASYIPGHAHADNLTFELRLDGKPFIVDKGISTYEKNSRRQQERSTSSHNTVVIDENNSSEVWGGFRLGARATSKINFESEYKIVAEHDGYETIHRRSWELKTDRLIIHDSIKNKDGVAHFHFHPSINPIVESDKVICNTITLKFNDPQKVKLMDYDYSIGFYKRVLAKKAVVLFDSQLITEIAISHED